VTGRASRSPLGKTSAGQSEERNITIEEGALGRGWYVHERGRRVTDFLVSSGTGTRGGERLHKRVVEQLWEEKASYKKRELSLLVPEEEQE